MAAWCPTSPAPTGRRSCSAPRSATPWCGSCARCAAARPPAARAVHRRHRRQHRQLPAERAALEDRSARRRHGARRLRRPLEVGGRLPTARTRPTTYYWHPESASRASPNATTTASRGARVAGRSPAPVHRDRSRHLLVRRLRQPRRADPGQRAELAALAGCLRTKISSLPKIVLAGLDQPADLRSRCSPEPPPEGRAHRGRQRTVTADPSARSSPARRRSRRTSPPPARPSAMASPRRTARAARRTTPSTSDQVLGIVLDTVVSAGGPDGSLDPVQFAWLKTQLTLRPWYAVRRRAGTARQDRGAVQPPHDRDDGKPASRPARRARILGPQVATSCSTTRRWCCGSTATPT